MLCHRYLGRAGRQAKAKGAVFLQMTKWLGMAGTPLPEGWQWMLRGVADSLRLSPFRLHYWTPPGLLDAVKPQRRHVLGKVVADAMEALMGVFYEARGPARNNCWLACLGLLPGEPTVRAPAPLSCPVSTATLQHARVLTLSLTPRHHCAPTSLLPCTSLLPTQCHVGKGEAAGGQPENPVWLPAS